MYPQSVSQGANVGRALEETISTVVELDQRIQALKFGIAQAIPQLAPLLFQREMGQGGGMASPIAQVLGGHQGLQSIGAMGGIGTLQGLLGTQSPFGQTGGAGFGVGQSPFGQTGGVGFGGPSTFGQPGLGMMGQMGGQPWQTVLQNPWLQLPFQGIGQTPWSGVTSPSLGGQFRPY